MGVVSPITDSIISLIFSIKINYNYYYYMYQEPMEKKVGTYFFFHGLLHVRINNLIIYSIIIIISNPLS